MNYLQAYCFYKRRNRNRSNNEHAYSLFENILSYNMFTVQIAGTNRIYIPSTFFLPLI